MSAAYEEGVNDSLNLPGTWLITVPVSYQFFVHWIAPILLFVMLVIETRVNKIKDVVLLWALAAVVWFARLRLQGDTWNIQMRAEAIHEKQDVPTFILLHMGFQDIQVTVLCSITFVFIIVISYALYGRFGSSQRRLVGE